MRKSIEILNVLPTHPAGRGTYVSHEVDEGHDPGVPCDICAALTTPEADHD